MLCISSPNTIDSMILISFLVLQMPCRATVQGTHLGASATSNINNFLAPDGSLIGDRMFLLPC